MTSLRERKAVIGCYKTLSKIAVATMGDRRARARFTLIGVRKFLVGFMDEALKVIPGSVAAFHERAVVAKVLAANPDVIYSTEIGAAKKVHILPSTPPAALISSIAIISASADRPAAPLYGSQRRLRPAITSGEPSGSSLRDLA